MKNTHENHGKRFLLAAFALLLAVLTLAVCIPAVFAVTDEETIASYAPAGTENVAAGASVTVSKCTANRVGRENSYEMTNERWSKTFLTDGVLDNGWSTDPYDKEQNVNEPVSVTLKLTTTAKIKGIALFPFGCFPEDYTVSLSSDGNNFTKVAQSTGNPGKVSKPNVHSFSETSAQYVRIDITKRSSNVTADGALAQFGEIAVYGGIDASLNMNKNALELYVGETDKLTASFKGTNASTITWKSGDTSVVTVDAQGNLVAKAAGTATVTAQAGSLKAECRVYVVAKKFSFDDNILISIFWPPTPEYINDEQYKLMADAGITWVMGAGEETLRDKNIQLKMLELSYKYGMHMTVHDGKFGGNLLSKSDSAIAELVEVYRNVPGANGYYMLDEPFNPNIFLNAYRALKTADPNSYMHLNFLPSGCYSSDKLYMSQMNDWCKLCNATGYKLDYVMYDRYPFGLAKGSLDRHGFLTNLKDCHDVGLANGVKTGTYIQTVCQSVSFRRPTASEIRYEVNMALAYGYKQLSYFTWFTPTNRNEPFEDGIIAPDGTPNAHYADVSKINHEALALGKTLIKCDALGIYINGETWGQDAIPADFFAKSNDSKQYTLSWLRDRESGRNYLMVVNNNFTNAASFSLTFDNAITSLSEVSKTDGSLSAVKTDGQKLTLNLAAGDSILLALPEGYDYMKPRTEPVAGTNLALDAQITCDSSCGEDGWYMNNLNDGLLLSDGSSNGWKSNGTKTASITVDLGISCNFNRVDLYPSGYLFDYGKNMPKDFTVSVSEDGKTWSQVAEIKDYKVKNNTAPSVKFEKANARFIRIDISAYNGAFVNLNEIEVYMDNGSVPAPKSFAAINGGDEIITYTDGENIALNKVVYVSSTTPDSTFRQWNWAVDFINDGKAETGWTSNVKIHDSEDSTEYAIVDLGDVFAINRIVVTEKGLYPVDFKIQLSDDGIHWTTYYKEMGAATHTDGYVNEYKVTEAVTGRYLRFIATKLRNTAVDGYMLQLADIEAYGTPVCDKAPLDAALTAYTDASGDKSAKLYTDATEAILNDLTTQSQADDLTKKLYEAVGLTPPAPDTETETDTKTDTDTETETDTEPDTDTESQTGTETDTVTATESNTVTTAVGSETTAVDAQDTTETSNDSGCGSIAALPVLLVISAVTAFTVIRRKQED